MKLKGLLGGDFEEGNGNDKKPKDDTVYSNVCVYSNDPTKFQVSK